MAQEIEEISNLEKRIHNLEVALSAITTITLDTLPPSYADDVNKVMLELYDNSKTIGAFDDRLFFNSKTKTRG